MAGLAGIEPTSPSSKHGILSIELKTGGPASKDRTYICRLGGNRTIHCTIASCSGAQGRIRTDTVRLLRPLSPTSCTTWALSLVPSTGLEPAESRLSI